MAQLNSTIITGNLGVVGNLTVDKKLNVNGAISGDITFSNLATFDNGLAGPTATYTKTLNSKSQKVYINVENGGDQYFLRTTLDNTGKFSIDKNGKITAAGGGTFNKVVTITSGGLSMDSGTSACIRTLTKPTTSWSNPHSVTILGGTGQTEASIKYTLNSSHINDNIDGWVAGLGVGAQTYFGWFYRGATGDGTTKMYLTPDCTLHVGDANSTGIVDAASFVARSDARLKENIIEYKSEKSILDLPIYKYDFINGTKNQIGCLAQDLKEICPEIVSENEDGYLGIQESKLVYLLLNEVKKLKAEVEELKK